MAAALSGLRIVEFAGLGPAPFAGMMLADHGADVLRIHGMGPRRGIPSIDTDNDVLARGRPSIALDLKAGPGRELARDLVARADGLIEGFRPGVMERLGLGPDVCLERNPKLVYGRMTGWGQNGPLADRAGHDINYIALTGVLGALGPTERPTAPINLLGDFGAGGMLLAFGMLAGVLNARATGAGQVVDAAMTDGAALLSAMIHGLRNAGEWEDARESNFLDGGAYYYGTYACSDGKFVAVGSIEAKFHGQLLAGLGLDPAEFDQSSRAEWARARGRVAAAFASAPQDHWAAIFEGSDACVTPVLSWDEAAAHPHNRSRETFIGRGGGMQPAPAPKFERTPAPAPGPVHPPGSDAAQVLAPWGIGRDRVARLRSSGALGFWDAV